MKDSMQCLIKMFPHLFDKSETSNFFKSQSVTNNVFKGIFQSISDVSDSFRLRKRCCIWKEQSVPYDYVINFVVNYPQLKSVKCYKNDTLIYIEEYLEKDNVSSFIYSYDNSKDNTIVDYDSEDNEEENQGDDSEIEIPIIPEDTFHIIAESYDEIIIKKGFPENDEPLGNIYDHDISLDEIGALHGIPRKTYIPTEDYANTEPTYNDRLTEDDYHYMNRIINYVLRVHDTPLPVLEIWKQYGIFSNMINREQYLLKMFDETKHPFDEETGLVGDWTPMPWEHKDKLCNLQPDLGRFFFVSANTLSPVKNQAVKFNFKYLNSLAEQLTGDYNVTILLQGEEEDTVLVENYPGEQYTVGSELISDDEPNIFIFNAYYGKDLFTTEELTVNVRGCNTADWYVSTSGSDSGTGQSDDPFATLDKALSMVNGEENLIVLTSGTHSTDHIFNVPYTCTVLGCGDPIITSTDGLKFFRVYQNQSLNIQDITLQHDTSSSLIENSNWINNNKTNNPLYVVLSEAAGKTLTTITLSTDYSTYTIGDTINITGTLKENEEDTGLSNKSVKIYVNNELIGAATTLTGGSFSKSITASASGTVIIRAVFETDEDYAGSTGNASVTVNKKTSTISFAADKASYDLGETISLTGTLKSGTTNIGSASIEIYDGGTLLDTVTTLSNGTFSKTITAETVESKSFHAVYNGNATYESATSSNVNVTITKGTPTITLLSSSVSVTTGDSYIISGALLYNGTGVANASVKLYQGQSVIDTLTTANDGTFSKTITSTAEGTFTYHVVFDATTTYTGVTSGNVTVTVSALSFDAIELTSDKDIISAYDHESATLTVQLMSGTSPASVAGETVTFEVRKTSDDSLVETLTADTNGSGVAEYTYNSQGVGDVTITAECMNLVQTYSVSDCIIANVNVSYTGTSTSDTVYSLGYDEIADLSGIDFEMEWTFRQTARGCDVCLGASSEFSVTPIKSNYRVLLGNSGAGAIRYGYRTTSTNASTTGSIGVNTDVSMRIVKNGTSFEYYVNDKLLGTKTVSFWTNYDMFGIHTVQWNTGTTTISNLKIKPLP